jgi:hypothetical protein
VKQAAVGGDHEDAVDSARRRGEGARVGELAAEIEPADHGEDVADRRAGGVPHGLGEDEAGARIQHHLRALAAAAGRREKEDPRRHYRM